LWPSLAPVSTGNTAAPASLPAPVHTTGALSLLPQPTQPHLSEMMLQTTGISLSPLEAQGLQHTRPVESAKYSIPAYALRSPHAHLQHNADQHDVTMWSEEQHSAMQSTPPNMSGYISKPNIFPIAIRQRELSNYGSTDGKQCESCGTTRSPEWRRGPSGHKT
jgi:hypothetical protein